jgi:hypothetical protein
MSKIIVMGFLAIFIFTPALAEEYHWKSPQHFEISNIEGLLDSYAPGEQIVFYVEGKSPEKVDSEPNSGFHVQAHVIDKKSAKTCAAANGKYDAYRHAWKVVFTAPKDTSKAYTMEIGLYCSKDDSPCAEIYGRAARTRKTVPFQVR